MTTVAVFGGSFNPPHIGHLSMVVQALTLPHIDSVWVIPCFQQAGKNLISFDHRYDMCLKLFQDLPRVVVSSVEKDLGGESYTYRTLEHLRAQAPDTHHILMVGEDLRPHIDSWRNADRLQRQYSIQFFPRDNRVSSTLIREALASRATNFFQQKKVIDFLPYSINSYITENGLYRHE